MKFKTIVGAVFVFGAASTAALTGFWNANPAIAQSDASAEEPLIKAAPLGLAELPTSNRLPRDIVALNPDGDVTIIEFLDYYCHVCQQISEEVQEIAREDGNIRVVLREFPILNGQNSVIMARLALASYKQGIYLEVHNAFMETHGRISVDSAVEMIANLGGDIDQLQQDVNDPDIMQLIRFNVEQGLENNLRATPSFIIGGVAMQGYPGADNIRGMVAEIRAANKAAAEGEGS